MDLFSLTSSLGTPSTTYRHCPFRLQVGPFLKHFKHRHHQGELQITSRSLPLLSTWHRPSFSAAAAAKDEGPVAVMNLEELMEKDWSFLEPDSSKTKEDHAKKTEQVIHAGQIGEESRVLVSLGSDYFIDRLVDSSPHEFLLAVHESFLQLALIVERHDGIKCWKGELTLVPEKWAPFDVVFLYCLPALPFKLAEIFSALTRRCSPGSRIVISHLQGRQGLVQQKLQLPYIIVSDLPDKLTLERAASDHSFTVVDFKDEPSLYLAVLEPKRTGS